ncbi:MAG: trypsin-like serine protease [Sinobacteraceae bacterium]|nr:trypsin-like serine protease [Nevskiaceae bacterium]
MNLRRCAALCLCLNLLAATAAAADFKPDLSTLAAVPRYTADGAAVAKALASAVQNKSRPLQYAVAVDLPLEISDGRWDTIDAHTSAWRIRVGSPGAVSLAFEFSRFQLPADARLWIYDAQGQVVQGPYTAADQTPEGKLWTAIVPGGEAVVEVRVPSAERDRVRVRIGRVDHAFRDLSGHLKTSALGGGSAGSCEVNVACPAGDDWRNEIRAVAVVSIGGQYLCTGQLVNDVPGDNKPYFLTANHCEIGQTPSTPASSLVVYWNYQASTCTGTSGPINQNQSGATLIAGDVGSDFTLVQLDRQPDPSFGVWYAGWDVTGTPSPSGVDIHHPQADIKKISTYDTPTTKALVNLKGTSRNVQAWNVNWSQGATEDGSSGSGLYNSDHHLIGVLSGGDSSCSTPNGTDSFGRLDAAWLGTGQPSPSNVSSQLKPWLDPCNSGTTVLNGRNPSDPGGPSCKSGGGGAISPGLLLVVVPIAALRFTRPRKGGA